MDSRYESHEVAKKNYESAMEGRADTVKGVQLGNSPNMWRENNPVHPYADTPCENFIPTPTMHSGEDSKTKRILKYIAIGLFVAFMIYALIAIIMENPNIFKLGNSSVRQYF